MEQTEFENRILNKQWDDAEDDPDEWYKESGGEGFIRIGNKLVGKGFTHEEALSLLGSCHRIVSREYGN